MCYSPSSVRNPALGNLEVPGQQVDAAMDVRDNEARGRREDRRDFWGFLYALVKGA